MSRKNRNKKAARKKKTSAKPKKVTQAVASGAEPAPAPTQEAAVIREEPSSGGGAMIGMRKMISGGAPAKEGFFNKRRTLAEWLLWFGGAVALYFVVRSFLAE